MSLYLTSACLLRARPPRGGYNLNLANPGLPCRLHKHFGLAGSPHSMYALTQSDAQALLAAGRTDDLVEKVKRRPQRAAQVAALCGGGRRLPGG